MTIGAETQPLAGLMWQIGGSVELTFESAAHYVREMNAIRLAGFDDWRLPRLPEAAATLCPHVTGSLHVLRGFGPQQSIWTSDRTNDAAILIVDYGTGRIVPALPNASHSIRVVRVHQD